MPTGWIGPALRVVDAARALATRQDASLADATTGIWQDIIVELQKRSEALAGRVGEFDGALKAGAIAYLNRAADALDINELVERRAELPSVVERALDCVRYTRTQANFLVEEYLALRSHERALLGWVGGGVIVVADGRLFTGDDATFKRSIIEVGEQPLVEHDGDATERAMLEAAVLDLVPRFFSGDDASRVSRAARHGRHLSALTDRPPVARLLAACGLGGELAVTGFRSMIKKLNCGGGELLAGFMRRGQLRRQLVANAGDQVEAGRDPHLLVHGRYGYWHPLENSLAQSRDACV